MQLLWNKINKSLGMNKPSVDQTIEKNFKIETEFNKQTILENFSLYFYESIEQVKHRCDDILITRQPEPVNQSMFLQHANVKLICEAINNLKNGIGLNGIRAQDLKQISTKIAPVIVKLVNCSLQSGIIPSQLFIDQYIKGVNFQIVKIIVL